VQDVEDGLSEFPHVILNQARVHDFFLDVMRSAPTRLEPDYSRRLLDLTIAPEGERNESAATSHPAGVDGLCSLERVKGGSLFRRSPLSGAGSVVQRIRDLIKGPPDTTMRSI
jgi:hypothetical protein